MENSELLKWIVGIILTVAGLLYTAARSINNKFAKVHERIDGVKDDYVRRDDLKEIVDPIRNELTRANDKHDRLIERK